MTTEIKIDFEDCEVECIPHDEAISRVYRVLTEYLNLLNAAQILNIADQMEDAMDNYLDNIEE